MNYNPQVRRRIAQTCARLMVQEGITNYQQAKKKAAANLGIYNLKNLPSNSEIEEEIVIYQRLFYADTHSQKLQQQRQIALQAMRFLAAFNPRLVGKVLRGTAIANSDIILHLFSHSSEEVALFLMEKGIPYQVTEQRFRLPQSVSYPSYRFLAGEESIVLIVFNVDDIRWSPPCPIDGKPMPRADIATVERLLKNE